MRRWGKERTSLEIDPPAVFTSTGTEMAYLLSSMTNTTGRRRLQALLSASQNSPSLVVPSPEETNTTSSPLKRDSRSGMSLIFEYRSHASAQPTAWRNWVPVGLEEETMFRSLWPQWEGIWRPPELGSSAA